MSTAAWVVLAVLALLLILVLREVLAVLLARPPRRVREVLVDGPRSAAPIPKIIWTYWHATPPSPFVQQCLANWQRMAPDHEIRQLDPQSMLQWIPATDVRVDFDSLPPYRQADWLRVELLARHGGLWVDASTLLTESLAWVHTAREQQQAEYIGFFIDLYTTCPALPIVENWFMAAPAGSPFVRALAERFGHALDVGAEAYLAELDAQGRRAQVVQRLHDEAQRYLLMHVCSSDLLDATPKAWRLVLRRAEDSAFAFHTALGWRKRHLFARLALTPAPRVLPALIKLRGGDRQVVADNLARGRWVRGSIVQRLFDLQKETT